MDSEQVNTLKCQYFFGSYIDKKIRSDITEDFNKVLAKLVNS